MIYIQINKGLNPPQTLAEKQKNQMLTLNNTPMPSKSAPQSKPGVGCPKCGHHHKPGSICANVSKSNILDNLFKAESKFDFGGGTDEGAVAEAASETGESGIPGHTGGNPYHGKDGKFTTKEGASAVTTGKGEGASPIKEGSTVGSGRGSHNQADLGATANLKPAAKEKAAVAQKKQEEAQKPPSQQGTRQFAKPEGTKEPVDQTGPEDPHSTGVMMQRAANEKKKLAEIMRQKMKAEPEKFEGGVRTPRSKRKFGPGAAKDAYDDAQAKHSKGYQQGAINRAVSLGANPVEASMAGQKAWMESYNAHNEAREQGIDPTQVAGKEKELSDAWQGRQEQPASDAGSKPTPDKGTVQLQAPKAEPGSNAMVPYKPTSLQGSSNQALGTQPPKATTAQGNVIDMAPSATGTFRPAEQEQKQLGAAKPKAQIVPTQEMAAAQPTKQGQPGQSPTEQLGQEQPKSPSLAEKVNQKGKYDQFYKKARKAGFSHEDAHGAANEHSGANFPDPGEAQDSPKGLRSPAELGPQEFRRAQRQYDSEYQRQRKSGSDHATAHQAASEYSGVQFGDPGDLTKPQEKPTGGKPKGLSAPFSQWYSAGHSIGAGLARPGGAFSPTAGFTAQRAHELLNPSLQPERGRPMAYYSSGSKR